MKITTVSLSRTIPTGAYMNDKIGLEASLDLGESESDVLHLLSARIEKWHKEANPHLYKEHEYMRGVQETSGQLPPTQVTFGPAPEINLQHERLQIEIENCQSLDDLRAFEFDNPVIPFPVLQYYNKRVEEFNNTK